jgi:hypothetical protein
MADRFCPSCGTEVDADARFCPTCGITLEDEARAELPAAPAWPKPETHAIQPPDTQPATSAVPPPPPAPPPSAAAPALEPAQPVPPPPPPPPIDRQGIDLPLTWPTMASGWLIGIGSLVGAIALIPSLSDMLSVLLLLALLGLAATVFLAEWVPAIPRLRLITLVVTTIGLGIALDRSAFMVRGIETLLLLAMLAAVAGALLIELDRDRPLPPPGSAGG